MARPARVAVACKLAVIPHRMWREKTAFRFGELPAKDWGWDWPGFVATETAFAKAADPLSAAR